MTDEDIYAFRPLPERDTERGTERGSDRNDDRPPPPHRRPVPGRRPRRAWPWLLGAVLLLFIGLIAACAAGLMSLVDVVQQGVHISIDGEPWGGADVSLPHGALALTGIATGLALALLAVLVVVPGVVLLVLVVAGLAVACGLIATLGSALLVGAIVLSPLWLLGWLLWLALRPARYKPARGARMAA